MLLFFLKYLQVWLYKEEQLMFAHSLLQRPDIVKSSCNKEQGGLAVTPIVIEPELEGGEKEVKSLLPLSASFVIVPASTP